MSRMFNLSLILGVILSLVLVACGAPAPAAEAPAQVEPPAQGDVPTSGSGLKITGKVASEQNWSEAEVKAMNTLDVESTNKDGEASTYTGVLISDLLALAGPNADAVSVNFFADDGYSVEVGLEDLNACADCIVSFRNQGGFSIVMPGYPDNMQVKGVVEIRVQ